MLRQRLEQGSDHGGEPGTLSVVLGLARRRQHELEAAARPLGARLFAESPKALARRLGASWSVAHGA